LRVRHVSRVSQTGEFLRMSPESTRVPSTHLQRTLPEAPECAASPASDTFPGRPRVRRVSRDPRRTLDAPGCATCTEARDPPGHFPSASRPESPTPRDYPRAFGEHATCPRECFLFHRILENTQKIVRTL